MITVVHIAPLPRTLELFVLPMEREANASGYRFVYATGKGDEFPLANWLSLPIGRGRDIPASWLASGRSRDVLGKLNADIVHVHTPAAALAAGRALSGSAVPAVYTARGGYDEGGRVFERLAWRLADPGRWSLWDAVMTVNSSQLRDLSRKREGRVALVARGAVPSPADVSTFKLSPFPDSPTLVWVGRFDRDKRPLDFVRLVRRLAQKVPDIRGIMVGGSLPGDRVPKNLSFELAHTPQIEVTGWVDMPTQEIGRGDLLIHTSNREGYGLVFHEAALLGIPSIAYETRGTRDSVSQVGGRLVPQGDLSALESGVLEWLVSSRQARLQRRQRIKDLALEMAALSVWDQVKSVYEGLTE